LERHIHHVYTLAQANRLLRAETFDLLLLDLSLPDGNALNALPEISEWQIKEHKRIGQQ